jgi:hypothetical protein
VAKADADPASDVLLSQDVFLPFFGQRPSEKVSKELQQVVGEANRGGYRIKVAVIGDKNDLGGVGGLWRQPKKYASFLGQELTLVYHQRLLVVMPNGFGFYWENHPTSLAPRALAGVRLEQGGDGLTLSAARGVVALARTDGVHVAAPAEPGSGGGPSRALIAAGGAVLLLVLVGGPLAFRVRRRRPTARR